MGLAVKARHCIRHNHREERDCLQIMYRLQFIPFYIIYLLFWSTAEPMDEYPTVPASITERYKVGRTLGDGNFAVVRECVERSTGREYALKIISKDKCRGKVSLPLHSVITPTS